jgi:6-phosphogluconate dehydrogenase
MGSKLATNILNKKHELFIHDKSQNNMNKIERKFKNTQLVKGHESLVEMINEMNCPRTIMTMLPAGEITEDVTMSLVDLLNENDTIIDLSNEHYKRSKKRSETCETHNINYLGIGISGGCEGALRGPSLMVGGNPTVYESQREFLDMISTQLVYINDETWSGHYCKMVHNGIEYAMLQTIADVFSYCNKDTYVMKYVMDTCKGTDIDGYLTQKTINVINTYPYMENILDIGHMNDTGKWCVEEILNNGIGLSSINAAVQTRMISKHKSKNAKKRINTTVKLDNICNVLRFGFAQAIIEGVQLIETQSNIDVGKAKDAWSNATIIECGMIKKSTEELKKVLDECAEDTRYFVKQCVNNGISIPVIQNALINYDYIMEEHTSMCIIMAYRNYFGGHEINIKSML